MSTKTKLPTATSLLCIAELQAFINRHGDSLSAILELTGGEPALDIFCELLAEAERSSADPLKVGDGVKQLLGFLANCRKIHPMRSLDSPRLDRNVGMS